MNACRGSSLAEVLVTIAIVAIAAGVAVPAADAMLRGARGDAGAREMAATFRALRMRSVTMHRSQGLLFEQDGIGWKWLEVADGNGNGIRTQEVRSGVDPTLSGPHRLESRVEKVGPGFPGPGPFPEIPPGRGIISDTSDPVKFGRSDLVSFSPWGSSSSGTLYISDRRTVLFAVVLYGPTARVRVWRYDAWSRRWMS